MPFFYQLIVLLLTYRQEAEAGSAEVQPARNIAGYLSIYFYPKSSDFNFY